MIEQSFNNDDDMKHFILDSLDELIALLRIVDHPQRIRILTLLVTESAQFSELERLTKLKKSALGNHLSILISKNLIKKEQRGLYKIRKEGRFILEAIAKSYLEIKKLEEERLLKTKALIKKYTRNVGKKMNVNKIENSSLQRIEDMKVEIVILKPMRVVSFHEIGENPEFKVLEKLINWAKPKGLLKNRELNPIFGFNNPNPLEGKKEYGYELWLVIDEEMQVFDDVIIKEVEGGKFAVTRCEVRGNPEIIPKTWENLAKWVQKSNYRYGGPYWYEKYIVQIESIIENVNFTLELYFPIV
ncbi:MAG: effector binding domain-containing protein [Candidatus Lokiarchaeota archaeon]|nr:effector binding domain-containing protein [Candidatus Lokiarchaeota archaeon]